MESELIHSDPNVMMGKPVIAGTRITVALILEKLAAGESIEQILEAHPRLTRRSLEAVLKFAGNFPGDPPSAHVNVPDFSHEQLAGFEREQGGRSLSEILTELRERR